MPTLDQQTILIVLAVVAVVAIVVVAALLLKRRKERNNRKAALRERFGPEYDRAVEDSGSERDAVDELAQRDERHQALVLRDLDDVECDRVRALMAELQYHFVEDPADALLEAQRVVTEVLRVKGYPVVADRAEGLRMLSVDHPMQTQPVRALLQGEYGGDVGDQRHLFLDVRTALRDIADISYGLTDAGPGNAGPGNAGPGTELADRELRGTAVGGTSPVAPGVPDPAMASSGSGAAATERLPSGGGSPGAPPAADDERQAAAARGSGGAADGADHGDGEIDGDGDGGRSRSAGGGASRID